jgi:hypothetical protein
MMLGKRPEGGNSIENSILLVGNGRSVLEHEFGAEIDGFETVARINNYETTGFERFVGSRTDIWFNGANQNLRRRDDIPVQIVVLIPEDILKRKGEHIHGRIQKRLGVDRDRYKLVSRSEILEYESVLNAGRPTTGTSAILWSLERFERVVIHGFDFFIDTVAHYHDRPVTRWLIERGIIRKAGKHDMRQEKAFVERLILDGRVLRLGDHLP